MELIDKRALNFTEFEIAMCDGNFAKAFKLICEKLDDAPIIDAEPVKHGQWIKNEAESALHVEPIYDCSACHNWQAWGDYERTPYCPYCGAKMDR